MDSKIIDDCKAYLGLPPYDDVTKATCGDQIYLQFLYRVYGKDRIDEELAKLAS